MLSIVLLVISIPVAYAATSSSSASVSTSNGETHTSSSSTSSNGETTKTSSTSASGSGVSSSSESSASNDIVTASSESKQNNIVIDSGTNTETTKPNSDNNAVTGIVDIAPELERIVIETDTDTTGAVQTNAHATELTGTEKQTAETTINTVSKIDTPKSNFFDTLKHISIIEKFLRTFNLI